jgi:hypothetical protein
MKNVARKFDARSLESLVNNNAQDDCPEPSLSFVISMKRQEIINGKAANLQAGP